MDIWLFEIEFNYLYQPQPGRFQYFGLISSDIVWDVELLLCLLTKLECMQMGNVNFIYGIRNFPPFSMRIARSTLIKRLMSFMKNSSTDKHRIQMKKRSFSRVISVIKQIVCMVFLSGCTRHQYIYLPYICQVENLYRLITIHFFTK